MSARTDDPRTVAMPGRARSAATVVANELRRLGRDRLGLFFILVLPFVIIIAIGSFIPDADVSVVVAVVDQDR